MIRIALVWMIGTLMWAAPFESYARYKAGYGFFTLGESTAVLKMTDDGRYETEVSAKATGFAAVVTGDRTETYRSVGRVVNGRLVPERFEVGYSAGNKKRFRSYRLDHAKKQIFETREDCKAEQCSRSSKALDKKRYAPDDILTLYHNVTFDFERSGARSLTAAAVGSKEPVEVLIPEGDRLKIARKTFDNQPGLYLVVVLNQEIFTSKEGELYINLDSDRVASKAVLKKTLLFGDVWGELIEKQTKGEI